MAECPQKGQDERTVSAGEPYADEVESFAADQTSIESVTAVTVK